MSEIIKPMVAYIITDGKGYWVSRRRKDGLIYDFWSPKRKDAALFHFPEVAQKIASAIEMPVTVKEVHVR